ncbi:molybdopterin-binding domain-containing protein [Roseicyclus marinus]|uniref:hypothetical protein n=1 Tax=Roseicyclus marinus TaxID=2161673 RepID=UPI00240EC10C|nr:hypothetical protein [Roseicyclus marinus]MDG3041269.1 hypothetical protein [Roseicyclus marinus]
MTALVPLEDCLAQALSGQGPVLSEVVPVTAARGGILAEPLVFPLDTPAQPEALRVGVAVAALDLAGASASLPIPLAHPIRVLSGDQLPPGADAVLPAVGLETLAGGLVAIQTVAPGEGVRRAGHDGRAGAPIAAAGAVMTNHVCHVATMAGLEVCHLRRPRVRVDLPDPRHQAFIEGFLTALGGKFVAEAPDLLLRPSDDAEPRLALAPGDTAWLEREGAMLVLSVPRRFDAVFAACVALAMPAMAALTGAKALTETRPLTRKIASGLGLSHLVLLTRQDDAWVPGPAGSVTLAALAAADACAILPPHSEGLPAGAMLAGIPLNFPLG